MQQHSCTSRQFKIKMMIYRGVNLVRSLQRLFLFLFVSVSIVYAHAQCTHAHILTYIHYYTYRQNIKMQSVISHTRYHSRPLWFNLGGHFYFMLISSRRILILHRVLGSLYMKTYVLIPNSPFWDKWLESYYPLYIAKVFRRPSWTVKFPPMGFLGIFVCHFM